MSAAFSDFDNDYRTKGKPAEVWVRNVLSECDTDEVKCSDLFLSPDGRYDERRLFYVETYSRNSGEWSKSGINATKADFWAFKFGESPGMFVIQTGWLKRAVKVAYSKGRQQNCDKEPNPTHGVLVGMDDLWESRPNGRSAK